MFFPEEWKIILIKDKNQGLHGKSEIDAFKKLKSLKKNNINLTDLVLFLSAYYLGLTFISASLDKIVDPCDFSKAISYLL